MLCILGVGGMQTAGSILCLLNPYRHSASLHSRSIAVQKERFAKSFKLFGLKSVWFAFHFMPWFQSSVWAKNKETEMLSMLAFYLFH